MSRSRVFGALRMCLGAVFLFSGLVKLRLPYDFLAAVYDYRLFGARFSLVIAIFLPLLEVVVAICLLGGIFVPGAMRIVLCMSIVFSVVLGLTIYHQRSIVCGCFLTDDKVGYGTLGRSIALFGAAVYGVWFTRGDHTASS